MARKFLKDGSLSAYALGFGYVQHTDTGRIRTSLYIEGNVYHVRTHNFAIGSRVLWDTFDTLKEARKAYRRHIREYHNA